MAKMIGPSPLRSPQWLQDFSLKIPSPSSNSLKIKTLIHSHIFRHVCQVVKALSRAKAMLMELLKENQTDYYRDIFKKNKKKKKKLISSIRLHYNSCSSHVQPMPEPVIGGFSPSHAYYDSTWNSIFPAKECEDGMEPQLSGYLQWLEEKVTENSTADVEVDEIDRLATKFIASCHEKFRLEKQESYRRYQEMMARSV